VPSFEILEILDWYESRVTKDGEVNDRYLYLIIGAFFRLFKSNSVVIRDL